MCRQLSLSRFILRYCDTDESLGKIGDTTCRMVILVLAKSGEKSRVLSNRTMQFGIEMLGTSGSIVTGVFCIPEAFLTFVLDLGFALWSSGTKIPRQVTASVMEYLKIGQRRRIRSLQSSRLLESLYVYTCICH